MIERKKNEIKNDLSFKINNNVSFRLLLNIYRSVPAVNVVYTHQKIYRIIFHHTEKLKNKNNPVQRKLTLGTRNNENF